VSTKSHSGSAYDNRSFAKNDFAYGAGAFLLPNTRALRLNRSLSVLKLERVSRAARAAGTGRTSEFKKVKKASVLRLLAR
jgi:hypothetical protein